MKRLTLFLILFSIGFMSFAQRGGGATTPSGTEQGAQFRVPATADQNFTAVDVDGNSWDLYELLNDGKYVFLDFDYTGWPYCPARVPDLNTAYTTYGCNLHDVIVLNLTSDNQSQAEANPDGKIYPILYNGADGGYNHYCTPGVPGSILIAPNKDVINNNIYPTTAEINAAFSSAGISENDCDATPTLRAKFSGTPLEIHPGNTVTFTDESTQADNPITSWQWTFEGGTPGSFTGQNPPAITYANEGVYDVKLKVGDGSGNDEKLKEEYITVSSYCTASATTTDDGYEYISNFKLGTINKTSESSGYSDFTSESTIIDNTPKTATVTIVAAYQSDKLHAWIDWNKDGDFDDADERVCNAKDASSGSVTFDVVLPANHAEGDTRMRIRLEDSGNNGNETPCGESQYGEVEDYTIAFPPTGINTLSDNVFAIYPNPSNGVFNIITTSNSNSEIIISDVSGKVVYNNNTNLNNVSVDLSEVNKGIYIVKVTNETGVKVERIIIK